jgi:hypothetical protein
MKEISEVLRELKEQASAASGDSWRAATDPSQGRIVQVTYKDGRREIMSVKRDEAPAKRDDVEFVAHSRDDVLRLTSAVEGRKKLSDAELDEIEERTRKATAAPWRAFLESDGGSGGTNVILVTERDNTADLYLWLGSQIAPGPDFEFVATARNEMSRLLGTLRHAPA